MNTDMDHDLVIAIVASLINIILSLLLPAVLKNSNSSIVMQIRKNYECNRQQLLISSIIVLVYVYVSLKITPMLKNKFLSNLALI